MIAAIIVLRLGDRRHIGRHLGLVVLNGDDGPIGHCQHVLPKCIMLLVLAAIAVKNPAILHFRPVDREDLRRFDPNPANGDAQIAVKIWLAASA